MLSVQNLRVTFTMYEVGLTQKQLTVITDLDLEVNAGEVVAVVGSSGSGKSLLAQAVLRILPHNAQISGTILYKGELLTPQRQAALRGKEIALIPQSVSYLDPNHACRYASTACCTTQWNVCGECARKLLTKFFLAMNLTHL